MADEVKRSEKHELARNSLPDDLKPVFDELVADYKFSAAVRHGSPYVSYIVLADIVRTGWRHVAEPIPESSESSKLQ
jgi:hypothetical protein